MTTLEDHVILYRLFRQVGSNPSPNDQPTDLYGRENSCVVYPTSQEITNHPLFPDFQEQRIYVLQFDAHLALQPGALHYSPDSGSPEAHQKRLEQRLQRADGIAEALCFQLPTDRIQRWRSYRRGESVAEAMKCLGKYKNITLTLYVVTEARIVYHPLSSHQEPSPESKRKQRSSTEGAPAQVIQLRDRGRPAGDDIDAGLDRIFENPHPLALADVIQFGDRNGKPDDPFERRPQDLPEPEPDDVA